MCSVGVLCRHAMSFLYLNATVESLIMLSAQSLANTFNFSCITMPKMIIIFAFLIQAFDCIEHQNGFCQHPYLRVYWLCQLLKVFYTPSRFADFDRWGLEWGNVHGDQILFCSTLRESRLSLLRFPLHMWQLYPLLQSRLKSWNCRAFQSTSQALKMLNVL